MRILTLNIWNYEHNWPLRRNIIAALIEGEAPDAVTLQETRRDIRFEHGMGQGQQLACLTGYHATSAVGQVYLPFPRVEESLTVLTREPVRGAAVRALTLLPHRRRDENHRVCLAVDVHAEVGVLHLIDTHFSLDPQARLSNAREAAAFADEIAGADPVVLAGDLNAEPDAPEIRYLVEEAGFEDVWEEAGSGCGYTYASFQPVRRIDYLLTKNLPSRSTGARLVGSTPVNGIYASDHLGLVVDLPV